MLRSVNPATGQEIGRHPELTASELESKLTKAASAFERWRRTEIVERSSLLRTLAETYETHKMSLAEMATDEMGKTLLSAQAEIDKCIAALRHYADHGPNMLRPVKSDLAGGGSAELHWQPLGAVLAIMPWNFPYWQVVRFLAPTILAGNVGLLKHASIVQGAAGLIEEMMKKAGAPEGLFQNLAITSKDVSGVIADRRIVAVTLTGSEGAGMAVAAEAGRHLKKLVLELGGSDPFIVMPSADLRRAVAEAVKARIQNTGQSCICAKRMIVHEDVYDAFLESFSTAMKSVKAGDPRDPGTQMGPLSSLDQREIVLDQIARARKDGAKLLLGGEKLSGPGAYMAAGILTDIPEQAAIQHEEIFGPIAMVYRAKDIEAAIRIANATPYGLGSSVWTQDPSEQERFVSELEVGMTAVNKMLASAPDAPFGGIKRSGYGRELGPFGLHAFMNLKTIYRS